MLLSDWNSKMYLVQIGLDDDSIYHAHTSENTKDVDGISMKLVKMAIRSIALILAEFIDVSKKDCTQLR